MSLNLYKVLYIHKSPSKIYIQPVAEPTEALVIERNPIKFYTDSMFNVDLLPTNTTSSLIYGIIGIKELLSNTVATKRQLDTYLIVITKATKIGSISNEPIHRMDQAQMILIDPDMPKVENGSAKSDTTDWSIINKEMIESVLKTKSYYFSYSYDLTNTIQRINNNQLTQQNMNQNPYISTNERRLTRFYDERFNWNQIGARYFDNYYSCIDRYRIPLIQGFVSISSITLGTIDSITYILISRRSVKRAGTRYNSRGIDSEGNVSNFVETEQIVEDAITGTRTSYVQVRGSIPLYWSQEVDHIYRYKPPIVINQSIESCEIAMRKHFEDLNQRYGSISVVSLIDQIGSEARLHQVFSETIKRVQNYCRVPYHYFDFHKECSKMRWYRLSILLEQLSLELDSFGFFGITGNKVLQEQKGVIRSNCIDSLDRTNVVQSMIAQKVLESQLQRFIPLHISPRLEDNPEFMMVYKNTWADNADALSNQYAGTPALKTDFTRIGKRTSSGLVKDGINSMARYLINNFYDHYRQDAIELFLGHISVSSRYQPWVAKRYHIVVVVVFVLLYFYIRYI